MLPLTGIFADRLQGRRVPPRRVSMGLFAAQGACTFEGQAAQCE
jgi:hypothetical protein